MTLWPEEFADRYRAAGYWTGETLDTVIRRHAGSHPGRIAVTDGDRHWSYAELDRRADVLAAGLLARGLRKGDRVVLQLPNVAEFFEVFFGALRAGVVPVMALPAHRRAELSYFCEFTEARALIVADRHAGFDHRELALEVTRAVPALGEVIVLGDPGPFTPLEELRSAGSAPPADPPTASDLAFLQLSGGSTGLPKLIPRSHDDYLYSVRESAVICELTPGSVYLCALPAAHNFPLSSPGTLGTFHAGGRVVLAPDPSPATALALIERERVTLTGLVPPLALAWAQAAPAAGRDLSSLELLQVGGAKLSEEAARRLGPALGCRLQQVFGMAEGLVNYTRVDDPEETVLTTQGRPISPDDEVRIVDDEDQDLPEGATGHLLTRGPYTVRGYWRAPEHNAVAFTADGFYRTGDVVRRTPTGHLVVEGRAKDQINRGGEKVAAEEVENVLLRHPAVHDVSVVATPDEYLGERSCAYVILLPGAERPRPVDLKAFVRAGGLADYKVPDRVEFVTAFPQTGIGKVSKKDLRSAPR
ncbi:(2,3-dihydroxybenzoyl)adenylate synthase [Kitasatospora sp. NBC_00240]|uniref:(2,3-dihydroxybenzoyl)adenylate synthase n=1 Tax=Kitasatospora sp. NBC_00240 TaxID=2903567 RepID=UPI00225389E4|nr:(2,3-dihydroxybenzoyl)adenylate synthase [Kitasatospora sp. NBC_00240]MCX5210030.1 (2,3-dihydroxybenzoyl)adenylate synthase [Kitasatospora sp. NBC_00240]